MKISTAPDVYTRAELEEMTTVKRLRPIAKAHHIPNFGRMRKAEMIERILIAQSETQGTGMVPDPWETTPDQEIVDLVVKEQGTNSADLATLPIFPMLVFLGGLVAILWFSFKALYASVALLLLIYHWAQTIRLKQPAQTRELSMRQKRVLRPVSLATA